MTEQRKYRIENEPKLKITAASIAAAIIRAAEIQQIQLKYNGKRGSDIQIYLQDYIRENAYTLLGDRELKNSRDYSLDDCEYILSNLIQQEILKVKGLTNGMLVLAYKLLDKYGGRIPFTAAIDPEM